MSLVDNLKQAFTAVATRINTLQVNDSNLEQALTDLQQQVTALENRPNIVVSATEPPAVEGTIWLDTSGT